MSLPQHQNPAPNRMASAPYNFVPLPEHVVKAVDQADALPSHDVYLNKSGYFQVTLTTKSPLYVRCPFTLEAFLHQDRKREDDDKNLSFRQKVRNTPDFFYTHDKAQPVIPGSSLRGMLRSLLEIVSYGKVERVTDKRLFFRTVDPTALGRYYNPRLVDGSGTLGDGYRSKAEGGFWRIQNGVHRIEPCRVARVEMQAVASAFGLDGPNGLYARTGSYLSPKWKYQHRKVWVQLGKPAKDHLHSGGKYLRYQKVNKIRNSSEQGYDEATLALTGPMPQKHLAFVFVSNSPATFIDVPNDQQKGINERLVDLFHDDDQVTPWQSSAFPDGQPGGAKRRQPGHLRDGEPVFFLQEKGELVFFGRAQMFRLPYSQGPLDLIPEVLRQPEDIDYADALFGFVRSRDDIDDMKRRNVTVPKQGEKGRAYASRVFVTDAHLTQDRDDLWLSPNAITPKILATPKPTAFQHYLTQQNPNNRNHLNHYDSQYDNPPAEAVVRGHKRYWHQGDRTVLDIKENGQVEDESTQHTQFRPLKTGMKFSFRMYFENLSERELGALCWVLHPLGDEQKTYCHSLGMGKPLGMGAVKLDATLHLTDRPKRYSSLFDGEGKAWQTGSAEEQQISDRPTLKSLTQAFERHVLNELQPSQSCNHLSDLRRIGMLLKMMEWPGLPPTLPPSANNRYLAGEKRPNTRYMSILPTNEYRDRPVLPDPSAFGGLTGEQVPTVTDVQETEAEEGASGPTGDGHGAPGSEPPPAPQGPKQGDQVQVEIVAYDGNQVTVKVLNNQNEELRFQQPYYPLQPGQTTKLKVRQVDAQGRITQVTP